MICQKIGSPASSQIYHGVFVDQNSPEELGVNLAEFSKIDPDINIVLSFLTFDSRLSFPFNKANLAYRETGGQVKRTIFIRLEPRSGVAGEPNQFTLDEIIAGKYDEYLINFALGAAKFGKPIFVSFAHEMNVSRNKWYPWQGDPEKYIAAYRRVHDIISRIACNITWVWNPNIGENSPVVDAQRDFYNYDPGDEYFDVVAVNGYNREGQQPNTCPVLFESSLIALGKYNKPRFIGEFSSDDFTGKAAWLRDCLTYFRKKETGLEGVIFFNHNKVEDNVQRNWALNTTEAKKAYHDGLGLLKSPFLNIFSVASGQNDPFYLFSLTPFTYPIMIFNGGSATNYHNSITFKVKNTSQPGFQFPIPVTENVRAVYFEASRDKALSGTPIAGQALLHAQGFSSLEGSDQVIDWPISLGPTPTPVLMPLAEPNKFGFVLYGNNVSGQILINNIHVVRKYFSDLLPVIGGMNQTQVVTGPHGFSLKAEKAVEPGAAIVFGTGIEAGKYRRITFELSGAITNHGHDTAWLSLLFFDGDEETDKAFAIFEPLALTDRTRHISIDLQKIEKKTLKKIVFLLKTLGQPSSLALSVNNIFLE